MRRACLIVVIAAACGEAFVTPQAEPEREVRCSIAEDCDESPTPCERAECVDGICRYTPVEAGRLPPILQVVGDCQSLACDGHGDVVVEDENGDTPVTEDECFQLDCSDGQPVESPMSVDTPCGSAGTLRCDGDGNCQGCLKDADCGTALPLTCCEGVCCAEAQVCHEAQCIDPV